MCDIESPDAQTNARFHAETVALYQTCSTDLAYFKQAQWNVANYVILVLAGLYGLSLHSQRPDRNFPAWADWILLFCALVVSAWAVWLQWEYRGRIRTRQQRQYRCRKEFTEKFPRLRDPSGNDSDKTKSRDIGIPSALTAVIVVACIVTISQLCDAL